MPLREGQIVEIGLEEKSMLLSALLMYIVPLLTLVLSTLISDYISHNEILRTILIFFSTAISFIFVKIYSRNLAQKTEFHPTLLRVLS